MNSLLVVTAWNAGLHQGSCLEPAKFRTALMGRTDWKVAWVTDSRDKDFEAAPMFRKEFDAGQDVVSARVYMSARLRGGKTERRAGLRRVS